MITRKQKEKKLQEIKEDLGSANVIVLTDYRGLTVAQMNNLRRTLQDERIKYKVVKNTLARLAVRDTGLADLDPLLEGPIAMAFGYDDPIVPVKLLVKFAKENEDLEIKGGVVEKKTLPKNEMVRLAELPSREVLLTRALGSLQSPMVGFVGVLQANLRNLVYVLNAVKEQKEEAS